LINLLRKLQANSYFYIYSSLLFCIIALLYLSGIYPIVRFTNEQIDIQVYPEYIEVDGYYTYKNPFPFSVVQGLSIPFAVDTTHFMPIQISAKQVFVEEKPIPIRFIMGKHRFDLAFSAGEQIVVRVQYFQYVPEKNACYILTTTKPWESPLVEGTYRLFPEKVRIISSNYLLQSRRDGILVFNRNNFMPENNWHFAWEVQ